MAKILYVLYDDPVTGYPTSHEEYIIVQGGELAGTGAQSYTV